jgi:hypothetical protein
MRTIKTYSKGAPFYNAFLLGCPWSFCDAQMIMYTLKAAEKIRVAQFVGLAA